MNESAKKVRINRQWVASVFLLKKIASQRPKNISSNEPKTRPETPKKNRGSTSTERSSGPSFPTPKRVKKEKNQHPSISSPSHSDHLPALSPRLAPACGGGGVYNMGVTWWCSSGGFPVICSNDSRMPLGAGTACCCVNSDGLCWCC
jgi:hypothetical protein